MTLYSAVLVAQKPHTCIFCEYEFSFIIVLETCRKAYILFRALAPDFELLGLCARAFHLLGLESQLNSQLPFAAL